MHDSYAQNAHRNQKYFAQFLKPFSPGVKAGNTQDYDFSVMSIKW